MTLPRVQVTVGRMMVGVMFLAFIAALVAQHRRNEGRVAKLRLELKMLGTLIPNPHVTALSGGFQSKIEAAGDRVLIAAIAQLMDRRIDPAYVWFVRISDPASKKVVFRKRFDNRVIHPTRGADFQTTFVDVLHPSLPAGDYLVRVSLLVIPEEAGLSGLDDETVLGGSEVLGTSVQIGITSD